MMLVAYSVKAVLMRNVDRTFIQFEVYNYVGVPSLPWPNHPAGVTGKEMSTWASVLLENLLLSNCNIAKPKICEIDKIWQYLIFGIRMLSQILFRC